MLKRAQLAAIVRRLERLGYVETIVGADGNIRWRTTAEGRRIHTLIKSGKAEMPPFHPSDFLPEPEGEQ
jgi:hypothetical protein